MQTMCIIVKSFTVHPACLTCKLADLFVRLPLVVSWGNVSYLEKGPISAFDIENVGSCIRFIWVEFNRQLMLI